MPHPQRGHLGVDRSEGWSVLADDGQDIGGGLAASPLAMLALGVGLGPLVPVAVVPTLDAVQTDAGRLTLVLVAIDESGTTSVHW